MNLYGVTGLNNAFIMITLIVSVSKFIKITIFMRRTPISDARDSLGKYSMQICYFTLLPVKKIK